MSPPLVSIVIPTKDRPALLRAALESLALQSCRDFEAIVINDGGSVVEDVVSGFRQAFPLDLVELTTNRGLAAARNAALSRATGAATAFLDDDDLLLPDAVETIVCQEPSTDSVVYFDCEVHDNRVELSQAKSRRQPMALFDFSFSAAVARGRQAYRSFECVIERMLIAGRRPRQDAYERLLACIDNVMASAPDEAELLDILKTVVE